MAIKDIGVWGTMLEGRLQPIEKLSAASQGGLSQSIREQQLAEIRNLNALDLARYDGRAEATPIPPSCFPGCACQFAKVLALHIVAQGKQANPVGDSR